MIRKFMGFFILPIISTLSSLILLPIISRIGGPANWAAIGVGQAVGLFMTVLLTYGWNLIGGARIAIATTNARQLEIYRQSFWSRLVLIPVVAVLGTIIASATSQQGSRLLAVLMCLGTSLGGMTFGWFAVGLGKPSLILKFEALPSVVVLILSAPLILTTGSLYGYPFALILGPVIGLCLLHRHLFRRLLPAYPGIKSVLTELRVNLKVASVDVAGAVYSAIPIPLASALFTSTSAAAITSADKLYHFSLISIVVLGNTFQSWVLTPTGRRQIRQRQLTSIYIHVVLGFVGAVGLYTLGPWITHLLFGDDVAAPADVIAGYALAYFFTSVTTPMIRNVLIPLDRSTAVLAATLSAGITSLPLMFYAAQNFGAWAIPFGFAASEITVLLVVLGPTVKILRRTAQ